MNQQIASLRLTKRELSMHACMSEFKHVDNESQTTQTVCIDNESQTTKVVCVDAETQFSKETSDKKESDISDEISFIPRMTGMTIDKTDEIGRMKIEIELLKKEYDLQEKFMTKEVDLLRKECDLIGELCRKEMAIETRMKETIEKQFEICQSEKQKLQHQNDTLTKKVLNSVISREPKPNHQQKRESQHKPTMIEIEQQNYNGTLQFGSKGPYEELSNFYKCKVEYDGVILGSSEHHYQGKKGDFHYRPDIASKVRQAPDAKTARFTARQHITTNREWHKYKRDLLEDIMLAKLESNPHVREILMSTKGMYLLEDTPLFFWGEGPDGIGRNEAGKI